MPSPFTQSDVANLTAGDELNERVNWAVEQILAAEGPWTFPTLYQDRIRRWLGLPVPIPMPNTTYCGPDYSGDDEVIDGVIEDFDISYSGANNAVAKCIAVVQQAMAALGMT